MKAQRYPLWVAGDWNAFFGLGMNSLLNLLVLSGLLLGVIELPIGIVYGRIIPAVGVMLFLGNVYYAWMARRLGRKLGRDDVTALPSGPSVPHMFIVVLVVMLPVKLTTGDPILAWSAGVAWVFIESLVLFVGAFIAPLIRKITPRAALLGTLAGVSIAFISLKPFMDIMALPYVGLVSLAIVFGGWFGKVRFPGKIPAGLLAITVGSLIAWATGIMSWPAVTNSVTQLSFYPPLFGFNILAGGFSRVAPLLVTAIPFGVYDFVEAMNNVESAAVVGDEYDIKEVLIAEGVCSLVGTLLGSPFANAVYIGHPGWKEAGGRTGYSWAAGVLILSVSILGVVPLLLSLISLVAIYPILLYIGCMIGAQAFQSTPRNHAPAIIVALIPHFAAWGKSMVDGLAGTLGVSMAKVDLQALLNNGVFYQGLQILGDGAILSGLVLGAIVVFLTDHKMILSSIYAFAGAFLAFFGFIHGPFIGFGVSPGIALGYLLMGLVILSFNYLPKRELPSGELSQEEESESLQTDSD